MMRGYIRWYNKERLFTRSTHTAPVPCPFFHQVTNTPVDMPPHLPQWELLVSEPMPSSLVGDAKESAQKDVDEMETLLVLRVHHALADGNRREFAHFFA